MYFFTRSLLVLSSLTLSSQVSGTRLNHVEKPHIDAPLRGLGVPPAASSAERQKANQKRKQQLLEQDREEREEQKRQQQKQTQRRQQLERQRNEGPKGRSMAEEDEWGRLRLNEGTRKQSRGEKPKVKRADSDEITWMYAGKKFNKVNPDTYLSWLEDEAVKVETAGKGVESLDEIGLNFLASIRKAAREERERNYDAMLKRK
eukprot:GHVH01000864.1.p1 GENE.GHVH01000864.1~~GHVH01000864.1.p1  ORF type:complete len:203 (+),score=23.35 GHVH01000864.1:182-790(+)